MDKPAVFEDGTVTVVVGPNGSSVFVGAAELEMLSGVLVEDPMNGNAPRVKLTILKSHDPEVELRLDEELRIAKSVPWIEVER